MISLKSIWKRRQGMPRHGLMLLSLALIPFTGCASMRENSDTIRTLPNYSPAFLECVADEYSRSVHDVCTKAVIDDWTVLIGA
jgi:hypothetical protein